MTSGVCIASCYIITQDSFAPLFSANLIALLKEYGDSIDGFRERVGDDFARGHKEATGGIIHKVRSSSLNRKLYRQANYLSGRTSSKNL
jgi:hypothetical protein